MNTVLFNTSFFGEHEVYDIVIDFILHHYVASMRDTGISDITVARMRDDVVMNDDGFRICVQCRTTEPVINQWIEKSRQKILNELSHRTNGQVVMFDTMMDIIPCE